MSKPADILASGGGSRLSAIVGAYDALVQHGYTPKRIAGASAGAVVGSCMAAGYSPEELKLVVDTTNFTRFLDGPRFSKFRLPFLLPYITRHKGLYKGDAFEFFMSELLKRKNVTTFGDLRTDDPADLNNPKYRWKLKVIVSDISLGRMVVLPDDARIYGLEPDEVSVAKAVRASMSIPFIFAPMKVNGHYLVDGGMLSNYPIWLFDSLNEPRWPTFGILLRENLKEDVHKIRGISDFTVALVNTAIKAHDQMWIRPDDEVHRTIKVPTGDIPSMNFELTPEEKNELYLGGVNATNNFLSNWSWTDYKEWATNTRRNYAGNRTKRL